MPQITTSSPLAPVPVFHSSAGERFRAWRKAKKLSLRAVAARIPCSRSLLSMVELQQRRPGLRVAVAIERLSATWEHGPIRPDEWLRPTITTDEPAEPASSAA